MTAMQIFWFIILVGIVLIGFVLTFRALFVCWLFKNERCTKGDKHDITYKKWGITYQEMKCSKCGKSKVVKE